MNKMTKLAAAIALASGAMSVQTSAVELSANAGFVSEYYFRGLELGDAGAYGGVDADLGAGFYVGTWIIDDGGNAGGEDGLETDFYGGWGTELESGLSLGVAYNRYEYTYTSDFEHEVAFSVGFAGFGLEYVTGEDDNEESDDGGIDEEFDYDVWIVSWAGEVFGFTYGSYEADFDAPGAEDEYDWVEISASGEVSGLDVSVVLGKTRNVDDGTSTTSGDGYFFIDVSKSFDL